MTSRLLLQGSAQPDTVVTIPARDVVDLVMALAAGSILATVVVVLLLVIPLLIQVRRASRALDVMRAKFSAEPAVQSMRRTAENVERISESLHAEVVKLSTAFSHLSDRLDQTSDRIEDRIEEFNALLEVMQSEAEEAFVDGASTARGVRAGLGSLRRGRKPHEDPPDEEEAS